MQQATESARASPKIDNLRAHPNISFERPMAQAMRPHLDTLLKAVRVQAKMRQQVGLTRSFSTRERTLSLLCWDKSSKQLKYTIQAHRLQQTSPSAAWKSLRITTTQPWVAAQWSISILYPSMSHRHTVSTHLLTYSSIRPKTHQFWCLLPRS